MCQGLGVGEIVDPNNLNISPADLDGTKEIAADSTKTINSNLHRILSLHLNRGAHIGPVNSVNSVNSVNLALVPA
jgi:hypothetical protein